MVAGVGHLDHGVQPAVLLAAPGAALSPAQARGVAAGEPGVEEGGQASACDLLRGALEVAPGGGAAGPVGGEAAYRAEEGLVANGPADHVQQRGSLAIADRGVGGIEGVHGADDRDGGAEPARSRAALARLQPGSRLGPQFFP